MISDQEHNISPGDRQPSCQILGSDFSSHKSYGPEIKLRGTVGGQTDGWTNSEIERWT